MTLIKPLNREVFIQSGSSKRAEITSELQCDFRREKDGQEVGSIKKKVSVFIVDTDDTAPFPHDESLAVTIKDKILPKVRIRKSLHTYRQGVPYIIRCILGLNLNITKYHAVRQRLAHC